jgi:hypothetical protein
MGAAVFLIERRLSAALKKGRVERAPRTAAKPEADGDSGPAAPGYPEAQLTTAPKQINEQTGG